jgi:hypothetical protein
MQDGFEITFREMLPDSGILELVQEQLSSVPLAEDQRCSVVLRHISDQPRRFDASVELDSPRRRTALYADGAGVDAYAAVRKAFATLRYRLVLH